MSNPAAIQNGLAVFFGVTGASLLPSSTSSALSGTVSLAFYATYSPQSAKLQHKWDLVRTKDDTGNTSALDAVDERAEVTWELVPTAATKTLIYGTSGPMLLQPLSAVVITFANYSTMAGTWIYEEGGSVDLKNADKGTISIKLVKYANSAQNTSLATTVSS